VALAAHPSVGRCYNIPCMRPLAGLLLVALAASTCSAQLPVDQKVADFEALAGLYAKRYGPYEWKRDALGVDLFNVSPWLAKVSTTSCRST
jgi:hypothetical protein